MGTIIILIIDILVAAILGRVIISWLSVAGVKNNLVKRMDLALSYITEPALRPLRRFIPPIGSVDIVPMIAIILLYVLSAIVDRTL
jgi:YggT family protein